MSIDIETAHFNGTRAGGGSHSPHETSGNYTEKRPTGKALVMHEGLLSSVYNSRLPPPPLPLNYTRGTTVLSVLIPFPRAIFSSTYLREPVWLWWASTESVDVTDEHCACVG